MNRELNIFGDRSVARDTWSCDGLLVEVHPPDSPEVDYSANGKIRSLPAEAFRSLRGFPIA